MRSTTVVWIDTICDYPIYGEIAGTRLYNSSHDVSLPLAAVYLKAFLKAHRPDVRFVYHPRRLYEAEQVVYTLDDLVRDGDIVLTSCSTADAPDAQEVLKAAKAAGRTTVIGGVYPRFSHKQVLNWGTADYVCTGEGEQAILAIIGQIIGATPSRPIPGVATRANPRPKGTLLADLATLPDPDYNDFPVDRFARYMQSAYILATRGCPAPCHFCTSARLYGYSYRMRPVDSVVKELAALYDHGFRRITLADDTVLVDPDWATALFSAIARVNPGYRLKIRARADELSATMISLMVDAGVEVVQFGVESVQLTTRKYMHKRLAQDAIERAFDLVLSTHDLLANPLYMLAYPGETWEDLEANSAFIRSAGSDSRVITYVSFTTPYPDTGFERSIRNSGGALLTRDLKFYTNKFPVFIPASLLTGPIEEALEGLVAQYDGIADCVNVSFPTQQRIPEEFFREIDIHGF
ncbi:MAG TPA: radical SAM protein [Anaerolineae bacterium]|nr:radical SAM protein [Anaerolineae bacterium]